MASPHRERRLMLNNCLTLVMLLWVVPFPAFPVDFISARVATENRPADQTITTVYRSQIIDTFPYPAGFEHGPHPPFSSGLVTANTCTITAVFAPPSQGNYNGTFHL